MVVQWLSGARQSPRAGEKGSRSIGGRSGLAECGAAFGARGTVTAAWNENDDNVVSDLEVGYALAQLMDDAGGLVT